MPRRSAKRNRLKEFPLKTFTKTLIAGAMLSSALLTTAAQAADQKIGVVDVQGIVRSLPQFAEIAQTVGNEFKDAIQEFNTQKEEYNFLLQKLQRESATMGADEKTKLEEQIIALNKTLQEKSAPLQESMQRREQEEAKKLFALVMQAVDKIAADGKYDIVLSRNSAPFVKPEFDISQSVLEQVTKAQ
ncbi:MAG: outer membrane protein [Glaciecola sp.]